MLKVTLADFLKWFWSQPDEQRIDMMDPYNVVDSTGRCGCLMAQYGRARGFAFDSCSNRQWVKYGEGFVAEFAEPAIKSVFNFFSPEVQVRSPGEPVVAAACKTFGQLKKWLKPEYMRYTA